MDVRLFTRKNNRWLIRSLPIQGIHGCAKSALCKEILSASRGFEGDRPIHSFYLKTQPLKNAQLAKGKFTVTIYPSMDYAFVVALIAILDGMKNSDTTDEVIDEVSSVAEVLFA
ncbi:LURP-one-related 10-like protein [Tanacetum coccineum]